MPKRRRTEHATGVAAVGRPAGKAGARFALALGGGAARGLAHIGVLEVLEREGIKPDCVVGSSMGGLIGALSTAGVRARDIAEIARAFRFPWWFVPGWMVEWDFIFDSAVAVLSGLSFERLATPLVVAAADLEAGTQVILHTGPVLPAVRATCAVPGVMPPVKLGGRWLVDGALVNALPVDIAWMVEPDVVMGVKVGAVRARPMPQLNWRVTSLISWIGNAIPNPATAKVGFETLVRAAEIIFERQTALAAAMTAPEILVEPALGDIGPRDFDRLHEAVKAGRLAAEAVLPELIRLLEAPPRLQVRSELVVTFRFDPVCAMVVSPGRARARAEHEGTIYYFCSPNCRDCFERDPQHYLDRKAAVFAVTRPTGSAMPAGTGDNVSPKGGESA